MCGCNGPSFGRRSLSTGDASSSGRYLLNGDSEITPNPLLNLLSLVAIGIAVISILAGLY